MLQEFTTFSGRTEGGMSGRTGGNGMYRDGLCFRNSQPSLAGQKVEWYVSGRTVLQEFTTFSGRVEGRLTGRVEGRMSARAEGRMSGRVEVGCLDG